MSISSLYKMFLFAFLLIAFLLACSDDVSTSVGRVQSKTAKKKEAVEKNTSVASTKEGKKDYVYTSIGKRDPFRSPFDDMEDLSASEGDARNILSPLQNYEVNSFVVSGIVWGISSPTAMLRAPDGKTYIVKNGTLIGRNWGKVVKIRRDAIVILEQAPLPGGGKYSNLIKLKLPVDKMRANDMELDVPGEDDDDELPDALTE